MSHLPCTHIVSSRHSFFIYFRGENGEYFKRIGDQAIYLPVLRNANGNWHYEPICAYHYTIELKPETFQTDDAKFQRDEGIYLRSRGYIE